jgi:hypothetical protein
MVRGEEQAMQHGPVSIISALGLEGLGGELQWTQFVEELPRAFLLALPGLLLLSVLRSSEGTGANGDKVAKRLVNRLLVLVWLRFLASQWSLGSDAWRHFLPDRMNGSFEEIVVRETVLDALSSMAPAGLAACAILLLAALANQILKRARWHAVPLWPITGQLACSIGLLLFSLLVGEAGRILEPSGRLPYEIYNLVAVSPIIFLVELPIILMIRPAIGWRKPRVSAALATLAVIISFFPIGVTIIAVGHAPKSWLAIPSYISVLSTPLAMFASTLFIVPIAATLRLNAREGKAGPDFSPRIGATVFAYSLIVGQFGSWAGLVTALAGALMAWPLIALAPPAAVRIRKQYREVIQRGYVEWISKLSRAQDLREALRSSKLKDRVSSGDITPATWSATRDGIEQAYQSAVDAVRVGNDVPVRSLLLGYPLEHSRWSSAIRAARSGAPLIFLVALLRMRQGTGFMGPFPEPLWPWMASVGAAFGLPTALTVMFGYFYSDLRGSSGLNKALWMTAAIAAASAPALLFRIGDPDAIAATVWQIAPQILLLIGVGVLGFDYPRMRLIQGRRFDWRRFSWFGDTQLLSAGLAATSASLIPVVASLVSKDFAAMIDTGVKAFTGS